jgi:hypothetical protein
MGGLGSGERHQGRRDTTSDHRSLDVRYLHREGLLTPGRSGIVTWTHHGETRASIRVRADSNRVILTYYHQPVSGDWRPMEYPARLTRTPCHFGGNRPWFRCPAQGCGRRLAILYLGSSAIFACRHCYALAYACQREGAGDRAARRAGKIRKRLGWIPGVLNGPGGKPKGMHSWTFERLQAQHNAFVEVLGASLAEWSGRRDRQLRGLADDLRAGR